MFARLESCFRRNEDTSANLMYDSEYGKADPREERKECEGFTLKAENFGRLCDRTCEKLLLNHSFLP
jgi:hypothetical protein